MAEMIAVEQATDAAGLTYAQMMENAGRALADSAMIAYSHLSNKSALGLVGRGNNGGDTLVALAYLAEAGWRTLAFVAGERSTDDPLAARFKSAGGEIIGVEDDPDCGELKRRIPEYGVLLDGLLGTGIRLPLREPMSVILAAASAALAEAVERPAVVAVDCPSGVNCDSGAAAAECLHADLTVCMAAVKRGLLAFPAYEYVGRLEVVGIGLPEGLESLERIRREVMSAEAAHALLPARPLDAHKGTFGRAVVVGGSRLYAGAPLLAGKAAFRVGAGWVTLAVPEPLQLTLAGHFAEATWLPLPHVEHSLAAEAAPILRAEVERISTMLVGPGFGQAGETRAFLDLLMKKPDLPPLVLDAEALRLLAGFKDWPKRLPPVAILTPHPGEMAALTGLAIDVIQAARLEAAEKHAEAWNCVVVLKGAFTLIAAPDGRTTVIPVATPALARAGTGDVLAGTITGFLAQGMPPYDAARLGAWVHAQAGLAAARRLGSTAAVLAGDLIAELPEQLAG
ncbi:MAG: NAD(P)H-hydrate dehydratase [Chloroflexi bacterium]|nr:NAD(P)H-hydrate dehydratase [Chloroflexota bacterium]